MTVKLPQPDINYSIREWDVIEEWAKNELQEVYVKLANSKTTPEYTQQLRGRASLLQAMLDWKTNAANPIGRD